MELSNKKNENEQHYSVVHCTTEYCAYIVLSSEKLWMSQPSEKHRTKTEKDFSSMSPFSMQRNGIKMHIKWGEHAPARSLSNKKWMTELNTERWMHCTY